MGWKAALDTYEANRRTNTELKLAEFVDSRTIPFFGGFTNYMKGVGNDIAMPFTTSFALVTGYGSDPESVQKTEIPADLKGTKLEEDLLATRDAEYKAIARNKNGYRHFANLEPGEGMRSFAAADHERAQVASNLLPETHGGGGHILVPALAAVTAAAAPQLAAIGLMGSPVTPFATGGALKMAI